MPDFHNFPKNWHFLANKNGFTLMELLSVIAILAIMVTMAVPSFQTIFKNQEATSVRVKLETFIRNGRQNALIYQQPIILCIVDTSDNCMAKNGDVLLSFIDKNNNHKFEPNEDVILDRIDVSPKYGYLDLRVSLNNPYMQLSAINALALGSMGHIKYCPNDETNHNKFKVKFNKSGTPSYISNSEEETQCEE